MSQAAGLAHKTAVLTAYRDLYKALLQAVQYSKPARYTGRDRLRQKFRYPQPRPYSTDEQANFDEERIANTLEFLRNAARETGMEHRVLKNVLVVWKMKIPRKTANKPWKNLAKYIRETRPYYRGFDDTVDMLNETMKLDL